MAEEEAGDYAFVDYVESACVVHAVPVSVGFAHAAVEEKFAHLSRGGISLGA